MAAVRAAKRVSIAWKDERAYEDTDTLVLTIHEYSLDLRVFIAGPQKGQIDWSTVAIVSETASSTPEKPMLRWDHIIDSRPPSGEDDQGTFATLDNGDVTETGRMFNPANGNIEPYVETWRRLPIDAGREYCVLELVTEEGGDEVGYLGRVGDFDLGCGKDKAGRYIAWRDDGSQRIWQFGAEIQSMLPPLPATLPETWQEGQERNCGFPIPNVLLISYPSSVDAPSVSHLSRRVEQLLRQYPLLGAVIAGGQSTTPYFTPRQVTLTADNVIVEQRVDAEIPRDDVLIAAIRMAEATPLGGPLWRVVRFTTPTVAYLAVSAEHELLDGIGLLRLATALTAHDISTLPSEPFETPVGMSTPEYKPTISFLLPIVYREMIVPALPTWLQGYIRPTPAWPAHIEKHPSKAVWAASTVSIDATTLQQLGESGKVNAVKTLHPIVKVAYLSAVRSVFGPSSPLAKFIGTTPRNERDSSLGHPYMTGNYTSSLEWTLPDTDFWSACRACYSDGRSAEGIHVGRQRLGLLAYLPAGEVPTTNDPRKATGWEASYTTKFENDVNPYSQSVSLSNLGRTKLPPGATDMIWGFPGSPFAPPLSIAIIGHEAGLRVFTTWREGCPVTSGDVAEVERLFVEQLRTAASGKGTGALE